MIFVLYCPAISKYIFDQQIKIINRINRGNITKQKLSKQYLYSLDVFPRNPYIPPVSKPLEVDINLFLSGFKDSSNTPKK